MPVALAVIIMFCVAWWHGDESARTASKKCRLRAAADASTAVGHGALLLQLVPERSSQTRRQRARAFGHSWSCARRAATAPVQKGHPSRPLMPWAAPNQTARPSTTTCEAPSMLT